MSQTQNKRLRAISFFLIVVVLFLSASFSSLTVSASALPSANSKQFGNLKLAVGGMPFGVKFMTEGVLVVGMSDVPTKNGAKNPAREAGLRVGDRILTLRGQPLLSAAELTEIVAKNQNKPLKITYLRAGKEQTAILTPVYSSAEARYVTGLYVRDGGAGIGTLTFIFPKTGAFAGLGHGICDAATG
ncbi:MAG: PDZ domain-containing protein, partial [Clostridia bacterium]|nr:PDZ domain-containing protein [Clostridia bacterium]